MSDNGFTYQSQFLLLVEPSEHEGFWQAKVMHGDQTWEGIARSPNRALGFAFQKVAETMIKGQNGSGSN